MIKRLAERFFHWYCRPEYFEDILGDLEELHDKKLKTSTLRQAEWGFAKEVFLLFRPSIIRPLNFWGLNHLTDMFRNYFKIGLRNIRKQPSFAFIHIAGLAIGLTAFLFLNQYTEYEKSYDRFHFAPDQLYRLTTDILSNGQIDTRDANSYAPSGKVLVDEVPEIVRYSTSYKTERMAFRQQGRPIEETEAIGADEHFLDLFNYQVLKGNRETMLSEPYSIVLTETQARKYFGNEDPIGKEIEELDWFYRNFVVTGVIEDVPENTHYRFDLLLSLSSFAERMERNAWDANNYYTYLLLDENADPENVQEKLASLSLKYLDEEGQEFFYLQPVTDIHLHSNFTFEPQVHGSAKAVKFLGIISIFILLIAWVNYINLSTAKAIERAKEVGLRKVVGARKKQLIGQFLFESFLINTLGALAALVLAQSMAPYFNELIGKTILTDVLTNPDFLKKLGLFFLVGTVATGFYPAFVLSSFKPIGVLQGSFGRTKKGAYLRKALVVAQFAASFMLIASTLVIYKQVRHMTQMEMGMDTEQVIGFGNPGRAEMTQDEYLRKMDAFREAISADAGVVKVGGIQNMPGGKSFDINSTGGITLIGQEKYLESTIYLTGANDKYFPVLDVELLAGRNFNHELASDTLAIIVNESFLEMANISDPSDIIGERMHFGDNPENTKFPIVGVVSDFNRSSLKENVEPTLFYHTQTPPLSVVKLGGQDLTASINHIKKTFLEMFPNDPFTYSFLDERFEKLYAEDTRFGRVFLNFSILAILVASMGLFGLSAYLAMQRTKEVGIRKVLGASVGNIVFLFFKDFLYLILIAVLIGIPLTYFSMNEWLAGYAHRIDFPWWVLSLAIIAVAILAFFTVSFQTWRLALLNPSETIRQE